MKCTTPFIVTVIKWEKSTVGVRDRYEKNKCSYANKHFHTNYV